MELSDNFAVKGFNLKFHLLASIVLLFFSCKNAQHQGDSQESLTMDQSKLIGEWRNSYTKIIMHTFKSSDSTKVLELNEKDWENVMQVRPIRTFFKADGTYNSEHRNLNDSIIYNPAGKWNIAGDSLFMTDTFPQKGLSYKYKIAIDGNIAEFKGEEDFDQDGVKDDEYYGSQKKQ